MRTRAIPERLRGVFTTRRYTNPRLPYLTFTLFDMHITQTIFVSSLSKHRRSIVRPRLTADALVFIFLLLFHFPTKFAPAFPLWKPAR